MTNGSDPIHSWLEMGTGTGTMGITKREYFAAMAMQGILSFYAHPDVAVHSATPEKTADAALKWADALIAALNRTEGK